MSDKTEQKRSALHRKQSSSAIPQKAVNDNVPAGGFSSADITTLQRTIGNDQLQRVVQTKANQQPKSPNGGAGSPQSLSAIMQRHPANTDTPNTQVQRKPSSSTPSMANHIQRKGFEIVGASGNWIAHTYQTVDNGAEIELEFSPGSGVRAKKIGLIQKAKKVEKGKNYDKNARADYEHNQANPDDQRFQMEMQKRKAQRSDGESHIDRDIRMNNPIYGAPNLAPGQDVSKTPLSKLNMSEEAQKDKTASNYQLGYRYKRLGMLKSRGAKLWDKPNLPGAEQAAKNNADQNSEMVFETTAIVLDGPNKGAHLGSVEWGFRITSSGVQLIPLKKLSDDAPSDSMKQVMNNWNEGEFEEGQQNPQIPQNDD